MNSEIENEFDDTSIQVNSNEIVDVHDEGKLISKAIWGGVAMLVGGILWLIAGLVIDSLYFFPVILIVAGIVAIIKGINDKNRKLKANNTNIIDDKDDLNIL